MNQNHTLSLDEPKETIQNAEDLNRNDHSEVNVEQKQIKKVKNKKKKHLKSDEKEEGELDDDEDEECEYDEEPEQSERANTTSKQFDNDLVDDSYDDDDDDDYCLNNKRLRIDEGDTNLIIDDKAANESNSNSKTTSKKDDPSSTTPFKQKSGSNSSGSQVDIENDGDLSSASSTSTIFSSTSTKNPKQSNTSSNLEVSESKLDQTDQTKSSKNKSSKTEKLKVPPLKIICSNPNGGLPYIKLTDENKANKPQSSKATKNEDSMSILLPAHAALTVLQSETVDLSITQQSTLTRSKAGKTPSRVSSPVPTTPSNKTTPTRRSNAVSNTQVGRSSPSIKSFSSSLSSSLSNRLNQDKLSNLTLNSGNSQDLSNSAANEAENVIRRKLRSHTRQLQHGDGLTLTKSPSSSPLTVPGENHNQSDLDQNEAIKISNEVTNETNVLEFDSNNLNSTQNNEQVGTRKRRCRQQQNHNQANHNELASSSSSNTEVDKPSSQVSQSESCTYLNQTTTEQLNSNLSNDQSLKHTNLNEQNTNSSNGNSTNSNSNSSQNEQNLYSLNSCIKKFIEIRNEVSKRRDALMQTQLDLKVPKNYQEFLLNRKNYLIKANKDVRQTIPFYKPPNDMPEDLKEYFLKQEKDRYKLRLRHRVEQDKLLLLYEQEILRCFNKLSRAELNQTVPFSFCSIIKDDEVYSQFKSEALNEPHPCTQNNNNTNLLSDSNKNNNQKTNEEKFLDCLNEIKHKFLNFKDDTIKRQLNESDSLYAVQKMDFQSKVRDLSFRHKLASNPIPGAVLNISAHNAYNQLALFQQSELHVPIVNVNSKFELFDASSLNCINTNKNSNSFTKSGPSSVSISIYS